MIEKKSALQISLKPLPTLVTGELAENYFRKCYFCGKECDVSINQSYLVDRLSGSRNFHCSFCLRHDFHTKKNKNTLILSFRGIIGHYYLNNYLLNHSNKIWLSEIEDFIDCHSSVGLLNPVFTYDPETFLWFVDFSKVGTEKRKVPLEEVLKTIVNILATFNLGNFFPQIDMPVFYSKYKDAIVSFHKKRYRPESKKILIPTFSSYKFDEEKVIKNFVLSDLIEKNN